jgi:alkyl hydroperoxide reductase subunit F
MSIVTAGDATTTPFEQIIIAAGEQAKAALSAFDNLIRHGAVEVVEPPKLAAWSRTRLSG